MLKLLQVKQLFSMLKPQPGACARALLARPRGPSGIPLALAGPFLQAAVATQRRPSAVGIFIPFPPAPRVPAQSRVAVCSHSPMAVL